MEQNRCSHERNLEMVNAPRAVILTGVPRSGTTMACALLNRLADTIALNEPMDMRDLLRAQGPEEQIEAVKQFVTAQRASLLQRGTATARIREGLLDDNTFGDVDPATGLRKSTIRQATVRAAKPLSSRFQLVIKHPNAFTALLPHLVVHFDCCAIVRHPLAVLASWNTLDLPLRDGHAPMAEAFDPQLRGALAESRSAIERQLKLLDWYFDRYRRYVPAGRLCRYEDIVTSGGAALTCINAGARELREELASRNQNPVYDRVLVRELAAQLAEQEQASYWHYYSLDSLKRSGDVG